MPHTDPLDPPRRRGDEAPGHGTRDTDRPTACGVVGRDRGAVRLSATPGRRSVMRRVFPRTSRGADEEYLTRDVAIFEWEYNIERVTAEFLRAMLGVPITTVSPHERHASFGRGGRRRTLFLPSLFKFICIAWWP